jgi:hypothetical protein
VQRIAVAETGGKATRAMVVGKPVSLERLDVLARQRRTVFVLPARPWPAGNESAKAAIQGTFYLLSLRAQMVGQTLVGLRSNDIIEAVNHIAGDKGVTAYASGPAGLALLHAAAIDKRITRVIVEDSLASFRMIATEPLHRNAPEYVIPGVLKHYDVSDLIRAIAPHRVEFRNPVDATGEHIKEAYRPGSGINRTAEVTC